MGWYYTRLVSVRKAGYYNFLLKCSSLNAYFSVIQGVPEKVRLFK